MYTRVKSIVGYCYDAETGFYYLNSRYYDPKVGRFVSADTTGILGVSGDLYDKNLYAYCDNNPVAREDICGTSWTVAIIVSGGILGEILGAFSAISTGGNVLENVIEGV